MDRLKRKVNGSGAQNVCHDDNTELVAEFNSADKRRRTIGPTLPPEHQDDTGGPDSESDSDDNIGPMLPPTEACPRRIYDDMGDYSDLRELNEETIPTSIEQSNEGKRDSWMLQPPGASDWSSRVDPTKLRSRKFQMKKSARASADGVEQIDSSWTESPQEKINRLRDQVMGLGSTVSSASKTQGSKAQEARKAEIIRERIQKYNKEMDQSQSDPGQKLVKEVKEDDDPSKRAFDREKDMSISSRISSTQRREMMNRASDYGSRFTGGKFL